MGIEETVIRNLRACFWLQPGFGGKKFSLSPLNMFVWNVFIDILAGYAAPTLLPYTTFPTGAGNWAQSSNLHLFNKIHH